MGGRAGAALAGCGLRGTRFGNAAGVAHRRFSCAPGLRGWQQLASRRHRAPRNICIDPPRCRSPALADAALSDSHVQTANTVWAVCGRCARTRRPGHQSPDRVHLRRDANPTRYGLADGPGIVSREEPIHSQAPAIARESTGHGSRRPGLASALGSHRFACARAASLYSRHAGGRAGARDGKPASWANFCSSIFQSLTRAPLLPPASAVINSCSAAGYAFRPIQRHRRRVLSGQHRYTQPRVQ